ncbi:MAG: hypothetical protein ACFFGZ_08160 [Candidatus Thorarchaeota archaeon]
MTEVSIQKQDSTQHWGWTQYAALLFLEMAAFSLGWVLFMAILKMNGIEILQYEVFRYRLPILGEIELPWWQIEIIALIGGVFFFSLLIWIKLR